MLFNSFDFVFFLIIIFFAHWFLFKNNHRNRNLLLLIASYFFYSYWDYRFLFLLVFSTLLDYYTGLNIQKTDNKRNKKIWFWTSIIVNVGFLGVFKYYNFFVDSFSVAVSKFGFKIHPPTLNIILPVGISFYTFHGLSYVIDVYKEKIKAEKNFIDYSLFVSYFPLLVAGPIERATHLLPQIKQKRTFDYHLSISGLKQILWGLFKKIVIADNCAEYANIIFNNSTSYSGLDLFLGAVFFSFQIYGDFSGYSDIALGTSKLFGIKLLKNFSYPYFSRDIAEFWRRWHISLSSWFKDYLYIPLGGSKGGMWNRIKNTFIIFLVSGFWHGANWTFIAWGVINAIYIMPSIILKSNRLNMDIVSEGRLFPSLKEFSQIIITFILTVFAWIFFRAENINHAVSFIVGIFNFNNFSFQSEFPKYYIVILIFLFFFVEWIGREKDVTLEVIDNIKIRVLRWSFYYLILLFIFLFSGEEQQFVYFQF